MMQERPPCWFRAVPLLLVWGTLGLGRPLTHGATAAFWLNNLTYSNTSGLAGSSTGSGLIAWSYTPGDFANGTGQFVYLNLPPYTVPPYYPTTYDVTATQVTGQLANANVDTYWYDWSLTFSPALSSPSSTARITGGRYDLTGSDPSLGFYGNFLGQVTGGTLTPYRPPLAIQRLGTNLVVSWPTNYADGFVLQSASSLAGNAPWVTSSITPRLAGQNYCGTNPLASVTNTFFRLSR